MVITNDYNRDDIIKEIYKARKDINLAKWEIENAEFRISLNSSNDEMWNRKRIEAYQKLEFANNKFKELHDKLISLKEKYSKYEYESLLKQYGIVLGMTEDIDHVEDSLFDEKDLQRAIKQTSEMIRKKQEELLKAKKSNNEDMVIILSAELGYYENDMRKHYWGESRLDMLTQQIGKTK